MLSYLMYGVIRDSRIFPCRVSSAVSSHIAVDFWIGWLGPNTDWTRIGQKCNKWRGEKERVISIPTLLIGFSQRS